jgi:hypothetical protein
MERKKLGFLAAGLSTVLVLAATLWPIPDAAPQSVGFCILCGDLGTLDFVNNVALFVPVGTALSWAGSSRSRVVLAGLLLSGLVESLQFAVPGRDPAVGDIVANTVGTWLGAASPGVLRSLAQARGARAHRLLAIYALALVLLVAGMGVMVRPDLPPSPNLYGQIAPVRRDLAPFPGAIEQVLFADIPLHNDRLPIDRRQATELLSRGYTFAADIRGTRLPRGKRAAIARVVGDQAEFVMLGVQDSCILYRQRLVSARLRLRGVTIGACHPATVAPQDLHIEAGYGGDSLYVRGVGGAADFGSAITLSAGLGWVAFLPRDMPLTGWEQKVAFLVFGCLGLPLGLLAWRSLQGRTERSHPALTILVVVAALCVALSIVPALMGVPNPGTAAISGTMAGVLVGLLAQRLPHRLR